MNYERDLVRKLTSSLKSRLAPKLHITDAYASASVEGLATGAMPDIIVTSDDGMRPVIIEIKGGLDRDLPLTTAMVTQALYQANRSDDPRIVIVTSSKVGSIVGRELEDQKVKVFDAKNFNLMVDQLTSFIVSNDVS